MTERAQDRRVLAKEQLIKCSKWPRTDRRLRRIESVLARRQPDLTVVLENVHDPHNVGAVLRSCDAVGILTVHTVYNVEQRPPRAYARTVSASAAKWIDIEHHDSVERCYERLRKQGFTILAAALSEASCSLYDLDLTQPIGLVFGNEMRGLSEPAIEQSDGLFEIPMRGMIESLNISVACAVSLFEASRQRETNSDYDRPKLQPDQIESITLDWLRR